MVHLAAPLESLLLSELSRLFFNPQKVFLSFSHRPNYLFICFTRYFWLRIPLIFCSEHQTIQSLWI
jgi:hypothetical protein